MRVSLKNEKKTEANSGFSFPQWTIGRESNAEFMKRMKNKAVHQRNLFAQLHKNRTSGVK